MNSSSSSHERDAAARLASAAASSASSSAAQAQAAGGVGATGASGATGDAAARAPTPPASAANHASAVAASSATTATTTTKSSSAAARSSSTESEGTARREFAKDRRARSDDEDEEDEDEDDDDDDERARSPSGGSSREQHPSLASSSTSGSPVRRLPTMLRAPPQAPGQPQQPSPYGAMMHRGASSAPSSMYGSAPPAAHHARQQHALYYGAAASPRDPSTPTGSAPPSNFSENDRVMASKRRLQQNEYASASPSSHPAQSHANQSATASTARALYESAQHHPSSSSSSSTGRSGGGGGPGVAMGGGNHLAHQQRGALDDDEEDDNEDPLRFETRGSHGPRDEARYETWTSKQLRKKCSHLKLRGLKNVKKHVMVEALYRYYRNQRSKSGESGPSAVHARGASTMNSNQSSNGHSGNGGVGGGRSMLSNRNDDGPMYGESYAQQQHRYDHSMNASSASSNYLNSSASGTMRASRASSNTQSLNASLQPTARRQSSSSLTPPNRHGARASSGASNHAVGRGGYNSIVDLEEQKYDSLENEVRITSEDVIRLVDVILSPEFVDRLASELSRWQFWVDVREKYISLVNLNGPSSYGAARGLTALGSDHHNQDGGRAGGSSVDNSRLPISSTYVRPSTKWSSMQLWEMWKELTFAYTKTCFEFTAAGMRSVDERNYIQFCEGRPDVYYLHQRLHARPDLLHLIKSNEYIEEKCSSDAASEHANMNAEKNAANALMGVGSPVQGRPHKRFKRIVPAATSGSVQGSSGAGAVSNQPYGGAVAGPSNKYNGPQDGPTGIASGTGAAHGGSSGTGANSSGSDGTTPQQITTNTTGGRAAGGNSGGVGGGPSQYLTSNGMRVGSNISPNGQQEEGSTENSETTGEEGSLEKSNSNATSDTTRREALAEQKYFGLLLQNFEAIFESLHNKKVLLAALRKDATAPDHLIADLHDDIHVLSALKKDFRNKLRLALE